MECGVGTAGSIKRVKITGASGAILIGENQE
jgi:hypothetical protein